LISLVFFMVKIIDNYVLTYWFNLINLARNKELRTTGGFPEVSKNTDKMNTTEIQVTATPGAQRGQHGPCSAYEAALRVTNHAAKHLAVDIGGRAARHQQRQFAGAVNRLVKLLARELGDYQFELRFLDSRESAKACSTPSWDNHKKLALQITVHRGNQIGYDVAVSHAYGRALMAYIEQTVWPHRGCDWMAGKTTVTQTRASKMMSVHAKRILATPVAVYAGEKI
jgi:hypothetical protein